LWIQYYNRYCISMGRYANSPNPYNEGTELEGVALRNTFKDGMRGTYVEELQDYVSIPLSQFGVRIFYNKDLLEQLTGSREPPHEYRSFLAACETIRNQNDERGEPYTAIAGSQYHLPMWEYNMCYPLTFPALRVADYNRDGQVGNDETFVAFKAGALDFNFPPYKAFFKMLREVTEYFQTGYTGLTRDEAVFLFAQEKAVFMSTGTWDARGLEAQAKGRFEVGVMDFPLPTRDDPYYGDIIEGPNYEQAYGGFPFAITRTSKHPEVALDFLLFMASKKQNEKLNQIIGWIPSVQNTKMDDLLKNFDPHLVGVYKAMEFILGGETWTRWMQQYSLYQVQKINYEEFVEAFEPFYLENGLKDFMEAQRDWRRAMHNNENFLAGIRAQALILEGDESEAQWIKYRKLTQQRQVNREIDYRRQMKLVEEGPEPGSVGPYQYSTEVLEKVKARL
jgi:ABC-type glycerol-3-phosphate transport system substrate-binding protein